MRKLILASCAILAPSLLQAIGVVYKTSTNDILEISYSDLSRFVGQPDTTVVQIDQGKVVRPPAGGLKYVTFNPVSQSVELRTQGERDTIANQETLQTDVLQIIQLRAYFVSGTQLGGIVVNQAVKDQIAIATNTIMNQIQAIIAKH